MKKIMIPTEVIAHFDVDGKITPYRIRYEKNGIEIMQITKLLKRNLSMFAGNPIEVYECTASKNGREIMFVLNFEKNLNKWFLTKT